MPVLSRRVTAALILSALAVLGSCGGTLAQIPARVREAVRAQESYREGLQQYDAGRYAVAIPHFTRALTLDPAHTDAQAYLAWSYYYTGQFNAATKHFRDALARQPNWEGLHNGLGWTRYRLQRYHLALDAFRQALALDPEYRDAAIGFAYCLFELGRYAEALPQLERLAREGERLPAAGRPRDPEGLRGRLAWTLFYLGDFRESQAQFRRALAAHPDWAGLHNGLGWSLLRSGDRPGARASFARALQLQPEYPDAREGLAAAQDPR